MPYWTVLVPDEGTAEFVRDKAADVDVFVDDDLRAIVSDSVRQRNAGKFDGTSAGEHHVGLDELPWFFESCS